MGWLRRLIYGSDGEQDDAALPKSVRDWQNGETTSPKDNQVATDDDNNTEKLQPAVVDAYRTSSGSKVLPTLLVTDVEPHLSSDMKQLELWITIQNDSPYDIEITKIDLLKQATDPDRFLKPNGSHEVRVYRGPTPQTRAYTKAFIELKISGTGDYFRQEYMIDYDLEQENGVDWYVPSKLKKSLPPQDT